MPADREVRFVSWYGWPDGPWTIRQIYSEVIGEWRYGGRVPDGDGSSCELPRKIQIDPRDLCVHGGHDFATCPACYVCTCGAADCPDRDHMAHTIAAALAGVSS